MQAMKREVDAKREEFLQRIILRVMSELLLERNPIDARL